MLDIPSMSIERAQNYLSNHNATLIDIRDIDTFKQGHIPQAIHLSREALSKFLSLQPKDATYIVCCYRGNSSKQVTSIMLECGFKDTYSLEGGFTAWQEASLKNTEYEVVFDA